ncbi:hypothetical protein XENOCAPTIV_005119, partial [Xenoophorus captivus]
GELICCAMPKPQIHLLKTAVLRHLLNHFLVKIYGQIIILFYYFFSPHLLVKSQLSSLTGLWVDISSHRKERLLAQTPSGADTDSHQGMHTKKLDEAVGVTLTTWIRGSPALQGHTRDLIHIRLHAACGFIRLQHLCAFHTS